MSVTDFLPYVFILVLLICFFAYLWIDRTESRLNDLEKFIAQNYDVLKNAKEEFEEITDKIKKYDKCCNIVDSNQADWSTAVVQTKRNETDLIDLKNEYSVLNGLSVTWNSTTSLVNESSGNWNSAYTISRDNENTIKTLTNCCDIVDRSHVNWDQAVSTSVQNKNAIVGLQRCCNKVDESSVKWDQASIDSLANKSNIAALQTCCKKVDDSSSAWDQASTDSLANKSAIIDLQTCCKKVDDSSTVWDQASIDSLANKSAIVNLQACCKKVDDSSNAWNQASVDSLANKSAIVDLQVCCKKVNDSSDKWDTAVTTSEDNQARVKRIGRSLNTEHIIKGLYIPDATKQFEISTTNTAEEIVNTIIVSSLLDRYDVLILDDLYPKFGSTFTSSVIDHLYIVQSNDMGNIGFTFIAKESLLQYNQPTLTTTLLVGNVFATSSWCTISDGQPDPTKSSFAITIAKPKTLNSIFTLFEPGTFGTAGGHNRALFILEKTSYDKAIAFSTKNGATGFRPANPVFAGENVQEMPFVLFRESNQPSEMYVADSLTRQAGNTGPFSFDTGVAIGFRYPIAHEMHDEDWQ